MTLPLFDRPDLLKPGSDPKAALELIDDTTVVTDLEGLYRDGAEGVPRQMTVAELRERLQDDTGQQSEFCLHKFQRLAVARALSHALSLIQVCLVILYGCVVQ